MYMEIEIKIEKRKEIQREGKRIKRKEG